MSLLIRRAPERERPDRRTPVFREQEAIPFAPRSPPWPDRGRSSNDRPEALPESSPSSCSAEDPRSVATGWSRRTRGQGLSRGRRNAQQTTATPLPTGNEVDQSQCLWDRLIGPTHFSFQRPLMHRAFRTKAGFALRCSGFAPRQPKPVSGRLHDS